MIENLNMSHTEYFQRRKNVRLKYPGAKPLVQVLGRHDEAIFLPAELVARNELDTKVREQLPQVASFKPEQRYDAIDKIRRFLVPGAQQTRGAGGLLPAIGIVLDDALVQCQASVLPVPIMLVNNVAVPQSNAENWAPLLSKADFRLKPNSENTLKVYVFYHRQVQDGARRVYNKIRDSVNSHNARYRLDQDPLQMVVFDSDQSHWGAVEKTLAPKNIVPSNIFVLDFIKPRAQQDPAYPVVKKMLGANGHVSQFVSFKTCPHDRPYDERKSDMILQSVARQILHKLGVRLWWVRVPESLPLPAVFVGIDVFHAPPTYDRQAKKLGRRSSCAAIIIELIRPSTSGTTQVEIYSETFRRGGGNEYELGDAIQQTMKNAMRLFKVSPVSAVVWRDGMADSAFGHAAVEEIKAFRQCLLEGASGNVVGGGDASSRKAGADPSLAYIICQKRIGTKLLMDPKGQYRSACVPSGTMVNELQGLEYVTFYINGRAPPYSTPKPVRFIIAHRDKALMQVPIAQLTWAQCHDYPNWTGPIKVPAKTQMAHKLAELVGAFSDKGETINNAAFKNKLYFL
jgi:hypothetical protein